MNCTHKLLRHNGPHPPGGFPYECPKTGRKFSGEAGIRETALSVTQYHLANPKIFTDPADMDYNHVLQLVDCWTCFRLGNNKTWCHEEKDGFITPRLRNADEPCSCGAKMEPKYCPTCSSKKLVGYRCPKCGKEELF